MATPTSVHRVAATDPSRLHPRVGCTVSVHSADSRFTRAGKLSGLAEDHSHVEGNSYERRHTIEKWCNTAFDSFQPSRGSKPALSPRHCTHSLFIVSATCLCNTLTDHLLHPASTLRRSNLKGSSTRNLGHILVLRWRRLCENAATYITINSTITDGNR